MDKAIRIPQHVMINLIRDHISTKKVPKNIEKTLYEFIEFLDKGWEDDSKMSLAGLLEKVLFVHIMNEHVTDTDINEVWEETQ